MDEEDLAEVKPMLENNHSDSVDVSAFHEAEPNTKLFSPEEHRNGHYEDPVEIKDESVVDIDNVELRKTPLLTPTLDKPVKPPRIRTLRRSSNGKQGGDETSFEPSDNGDKVYQATTAPVSPHERSISGGNAVNKTLPKLDLDLILRNKWIVIGLLLVVIFGLILLIIGVTVNRKPEVPVVSDTKAAPVVYSLMCGQVKGIWEQNDTIAVFKGIPYAKPPVGDRRWHYVTQIDDPRDCWNGTYEADEYRSPCYQALRSPEGKFGKHVGNEDCLFLNIWSPQLPDPDSEDGSAPLPVLVYIHDGGLQTGSGNEPHFTPSAALAKELNAVLVSFNYRLNVFGYLSLEVLDLQIENKASGNYGLWDQKTAIEWVHTNIRKFGGDPHLVTLAGLGSGGTSIYALLGIKDLSPKIHRIWVSGASTKVPGIGEKSKINSANDAFVRNYNCQGTDTLSCLRSKTSAELIEGIPRYSKPAWTPDDLYGLPQNQTFSASLLITDGIILADIPEHQINILKPSISALVGSAEYEYLELIEHPPITWTTYIDYAHGHLETFNNSVANLVLDEYPELHDSSILHLTRTVSDLRVACPNTFFATTLSAHGTVYRYVMQAAVPSERYKHLQLSGAQATHGADFIALFRYNDSDSEDFKMFQQTFRQSVREFMNDGHILSWQTLPQVMAIKQNILNTTESWTKDACDKWRSFYPDYASVN